MPTTADHRRVRSAYVMSWEDHRRRRCLMCGKWISEGQTAGFGFRYCESCLLERGLREETARLSGGAEPQRRAA